MTLAMVILDLACISYIIYILKDFKILHEECQSSVFQLMKRFKDLEETVKREQAKTKESTSKLYEYQELEGALKIDIGMIAEKIKIAQEEENNLEMDTYKAEFRRSKRKAS